MNKEFIEKYCSNFDVEMFVDFELDLSKTKWIDLLTRVSLDELVLCRSIDIEKAQAEFADLILFVYFNSSMLDLENQNEFMLSNRCEMFEQAVLIYLSNFLPITTVLFCLFNLMGFITREQLEVLMMLHELNLDDIDHIYVNNIDQNKCIKLLRVEHDSY